ncbi:MAG: MFS transporter, partial [Chloroflexota bacterium]
VSCYAFVMKGAHSYGTRPRATSSRRQLDFEMPLSFQGASRVHPEVVLGSRYLANFMSLLAPSSPPADSDPRQRVSGIQDLPYQWVVLMCGLFVQSSAAFSNQAISPLAPFLVADLGISRAQVGLLVTAVYFGGALVLIPAGRAGDRFGLRWLFLFGLLGVGLPIVIASVAPDFTVLLGLMLLSGVGNGIALPPTTRAIVEWFSVRRRGFAMGVKQAGLAWAGTVMGISVPPLAVAFGWRTAWLVVGLAAIGVGLVAWLVYREYPAGPPHADTPEPPAASFGDVVRNPNIMLVNCTCFLFAGVSLGVVSFMVLFLQERMGYALEDAGRLLALAQLSGVAGRVLWNILSDTVFDRRRKPPLICVGLLAGLSTYALSLMGPLTPVYLLIPTLMVLGFSILGWNGVTMLFVSELAGRRAASTAAGLNLMFSFVGIMFGAPLFGAIVDLTGAYAAAFQTSAVTSLLGLLVLWRVQSIRAE